MRYPLANKREIVVVLSKTPVGGVLQLNKRSRDVQFQKCPYLFILFSVLVHQLAFIFLLSFAKKAKSRCIQM